MSVEVARQAVTCGMWPLWEYERGTFRRTVIPEKMTALKDYLDLQGRFRHVTEKDIDELRAYVDDLNEKIDRFAYAYSRGSKGKGKVVKVAEAS